MKTFIVQSTLAKQENDRVKNKIAMEKDRKKRAHNFISCDNKFIRK